MRLPLRCWKWALIIFSVNAVNDAPVNAVPIPQQTNINTDLQFSAGNGNAISVSDVDAGVADLGMIVSVDSGALTLAKTDGLTSVQGDGTSGLTLGGTIFALNSALDGIAFTPPADFVGMVNLTVVTNDLGNTGSGGELGDTDTVEITVSEDTPPAVEFIDVAPNVRAGPVDEITIVFSAEVSGFDINDLSLRRFTDDAVSLLPDSATLTTADRVTWTLGNLAGQTAGSGIYVLTLAADGSNIRDQNGTQLRTGATTRWINGAGDANTDNQFNQFDLINILRPGLYLSDLPATWSTGDFNGDGRFNQFDVILTQQTSPPHYLQGSFAATSSRRTSLTTMQITQSGPFVQRELELLDVIFASLC